MRHLLLPGLSSVMMSSMETDDGDLYEGSFGRWGLSCVLLPAVDAFLLGECVFTIPPPKAV